MVSREPSPDFGRLEQRLRNDLVESQVKKARKGRTGGIVKQAVSIAGAIVLALGVKLIVDTAGEWSAWAIVGLLLTVVGGAIVTHRPKRR